MLSLEREPSIIESVHRTEGYSALPVPLSKNGRQSFHGVLSTLFFLLERARVEKLTGICKVACSSFPGTLDKSVSRKISYIIVTLKSLVFS